MQHASPARTDHRDRRPLVWRSERDRVLTGVAGGMGERLGIDPVVVRIALVVLTMAGGVGLLAYLVGVLVAVDPPEEGRGPAAAGRTSARQALALGFIVLGTLLLLREIGLWFGDGLVWPVAIAGLGSAVIFTRSDRSERERWRTMLSRLPGDAPRALAGKASPVRAAAGGLLIAGSTALFVLITEPLAVGRRAAFAVAAGITGLGLILGPYIWRLGRQVAEERRARIRSQERAEVAAHLHDSVLQTLALIQRSREPREMTTLARVQERELRAWLYGRHRGRRDATVADAVEKAAASVERTHSIPIEVVAVGDCPLEDPLGAVVDACREAMLNAARHSEADRVDVYLEVEPQLVTAYVRDGGAGFEVELVPPDRRGVADSIIGRVERNGGSAAIVTEPGRGTEVRIDMPRRKR